MAIVKINYLTDIIILVCHEPMLPPLYPE